MKWVVLADALQKEEWLYRGVADGLHIEWIGRVDEFTLHRTADAFIDLQFENTPARIGLLQSLLPQTVIINSVITPLKEINSSFIRINGWNTFLKREIIEAACINEEALTEASKIFKIINRKQEWVPDIRGFISARVIAMIINEAYFALGEKVSTREEIDMSMKRGTNYPYGPFEWSRLIGLKNIYELLVTLSGENKRYTPASLLEKEALR
jgi:3-hydroxybutyryl-CoA dehydrogenase